MPNKFKPDPRHKLLPLMQHAQWNRDTGNAVLHPGGGVSTLRSMSVEDPRLNNALPTLIPSIWGGAELGDLEAIQRAIDSGVAWPAFGTHTYADIVSRNLSNELGAQGGLKDIRGLRDSSSVNRLTAPIAVFSRRM